MSLSLLGAALVMGLTGGPHCLAMCAAPCHVVIHGPAAEKNSPTGVATPPEQALVWQPRNPGSLWLRSLLFHSGRLAGYALIGALAAWAMESLAWMTQQFWSLRPLWTLSHVAMLAWGILMMAQARQPAWVEAAGKAAWVRVRPVLLAPGGSFAAGLAWALMPCGLLYSALLVAALSNSAAQGALSMLAFALGSGLWLLAGPWLWARVRTRLNGWRESWGTRFAGLLLFAIAAWALWMDLVYKPSLWCR